MPSRNAPSPLSCRDLVAGYSGAPVLDGVSLSVPAGRITALVGPNGCGKSTLLKALARVLAPRSGEVLLEGRAIGGWTSRQVAQRLALLPQGPVAPEGMTVAELVAQGRLPHQGLFRQAGAADRAAVARALAMTELGALAGRPVSALSGGQRQRAWVAMVLAQDTPLLLLDEPTAFLDLKVQVDLMALLRRIVATEGRTLLVVLHELNLAAGFADHVVMMRGGRIMAEGAAREVIRPDMLAGVFGLAADVIDDPRTGRPVCLPRPGPSGDAGAAAAPAAEALSP